MRRLLKSNIYIQIILFSLSHTLAQSLYAQTKDNFSDGNFSKNPAWVGDTALYQVNASFQLQSNGNASPGGETSSLATGCGLGGAVVWEFNIKFNLSPSTQNFCRYYLSSDQQDLKGALNGYYIQFGGSTGNSDTISLYKQSGNSRMRLIGGRPGTVAKSSNNISVKVQRDGQGNWMIYTDTLGGQNYIAEGSANDKSFISILWTGIYCKYTSSNVKGFMLDDVNIYAGTDTTPPTADTVRAIAANRVEIIFSEPLEKTAAENIANYTVNNGIGAPTTVIQDNSRPEKVEMSFGGNFQIGSNYILNITGVTDTKGNTMRPDAKNFRFGNPPQLPLIMNEIMSDPSPVVG
jgi:hypothetical protein